MDTHEKDTFQQVFDWASDSNKLPWAQTHPMLFLADLCARREPGTALDIGCGAGIDAVYLAQQIKGVMRAEDAGPLEAIGVDALWVSNHAGRQFDGAPATIEVLPEIRAATNLPLVFDSGIEGGLDILRALALGADFVMLGRAFHFGLAALGARGPAHVIDILAKDMAANMGQLGVVNPADLPAPITLDRLI